MIDETPPAPTAIDAEIASHGGSTVAIDATQHRLQAAKERPTPSFSQIIKQRTYENGRLRQELAYFEKKHTAAIYLQQDVQYVGEFLQETLANFQRLNAEADADASAEHDVETGDRTAGGRG